MAKATDSFTNTNGTALTTHDANWVREKSAGPEATIESNECDPNGGSGTNVYRYDGAWTDDQYSQVVCSTIRGGFFHGVAVRCATGAETFYNFNVDSADAGYLEKYVNGVYGLIAAGYSTIGNGDKIRITVQDNAATNDLEVYYDTGAGWTLQGTTRQDASITAGDVGLEFYGTGSTARMDDWEGGDYSELSGGGSGLPAGSLASLGVGV